MPYISQVQDVSIGPRILIVDDIATNRMVVSAILRTADYVVDTVETGEAALEAVLEGRYDLILMDVDMPRLDGLATTSLIRKREGGKPGVTIAALTSGSGVMAKHAAAAAGMDDFIGRPISPCALLESIARLLSSPADTPEHAPVVWNQDACEDLAGVLGRSRLTEFLASLETRLSDICVVLRDGAATAAQVASQVHDLRSVAGMLGFEEVLRVCTTIQEDLHHGRPRSHLPNLEGAAGRAVSAIRRASQAAVVLH